MGLLACGAAEVEAAMVLDGVMVHVPEVGEGGAAARLSGVQR